MNSFIFRGKWVEVADPEPEPEEEEPETSTDDADDNDDNSNLPTDENGQLTLF